MSKDDEYVDPNSGAAPQPGGYAGPHAVELGFARPEGESVNVEDTATEGEAEKAEAEGDSNPGDTEPAGAEGTGGSEGAESETKQEQEQGTEQEEQGDDDGDVDEEVLLYDPSQYTVIQVNKFLEENPELRDQVIEAERAGENRKGIVGE